MGGSSPAVLFEDIDIPDVIPEIYIERFRNCGQVCDSVKRLIVHESIFEKVVEGLKQEIEKKFIGDPSSEKTQEYIHQLLEQKDIKLDSFLKEIDNIFQQIENLNISKLGKPVRPPEGY